MTLPLYSNEIAVLPLPLSSNRFICFDIHLVSGFSRKTRRWSANFMSMIAVEAATTLVFVLIDPFFFKSESLPEWLFFLFWICKNWMGCSFKFQHRLFSISCHFQRRLCYELTMACSSVGSRSWVGRRVWVNRNGQGSIPGTVRPEFFGFFFNCLGCLFNFEDHFTFILFSELFQKTLKGV